MSTPISKPMFTPSYRCSTLESGDALCLIFMEKSFLSLPYAAKSNEQPIEEGINLPTFSSLPQSMQRSCDFHYLGEYKQQPCYVALFSPDWEETDVEAEAFELLVMRECITHTDAATASLINLAFHVHSWDKNSRFCSRCGAKTQFMTKERGKECEQCAFAMYPTVSPCVIVAIVKDNAELLLAEIKREHLHFHSVLAGFVEAGETLEAAVEREVQEEVGVKIKNIEYFGSQPWAFSQSLMMGFTAQYHSGEIECDGVEVHVANWYKADDLPAVPPKYSIARQLIEWFRANH